MRQLRAIDADGAPGKLASPHGMAAGDSDSIVTRTFPYVGFCDGSVSNFQIADRAAAGYHLIAGDPRPWQPSSR